MRSFLSKLFVIIARKKLEERNLSATTANRQAIPLARQMRIELRHGIKDLTYVMIGILSAGFGLKGFLLPNRFIDGGATGISLLLENITHFNLSYLLILVNIPFIILAARTFSTKFAVRSFASIAILAVVVHYIDYPIITEDRLLIAVFGGFFLGLGIGMTMRGGSVIDGTEVLAIWLSKKLSITVGDVLLIINIIIFSFAAYILSVEIALYAILSYLSAAKTVDFVVDGVEQYVGVTIISDKHQDIQLMLTNKLRRACTIYVGRGGYDGKGTNHEKEIIYTVVTRLELAKLHTEIDKIDESAFIIMGLVKDIKGGMIKRKPLQ